VLQSVIFAGEARFIKKYQSAFSAMSR